MRVTLNNYDTIEEELMALSKIELFKAKRSIEASISNSKIPTSLKQITDIGKMSFGHFIVMEKIITSDQLSNKEMVKMLAPFVLRPKDEETLDNSDVKKEKIHVSNVLNLDIGVINKAHADYIDLRDKYLYSTYNGVIYAPKKTEEELKEEEEESKQNINVDGSQSARDFHNKKFFWTDLIMFLADGDIFKEQEVVELPMHRVMIHFARKRSLDIIESLEAKARR